MLFGIRTTAFVFLSLGAIAPAQAAAPPKAAGAYATLQWHMCQTLLTTPKATVSRVTAPITVQGIGGIVSSTNSFVSALTPASDNFLKDINGTTGQAIVSLGPTMNTAVTDVQPTSTVNFVTAVNHADTQAVTGIESNLNAKTPAGTAAVMSMSVGNITFPAKAASSGTATSTSIEVIGHSVRVPGDNSPVTQHANSAQQATFSFTANTATIGGNVWNMSFGDVRNGIAYTLHLVRRPVSGEYCIDGMTLTHQ